MVSVVEPVFVTVFAVSVTGFTVSVTVWVTVVVGDVLVGLDGSDGAVVDGSVLSTVFVTVFVTEPTVDPGSSVVAEERGAVVVDVDGTSNPVAVP